MRCLAVPQCTTFSVLTAKSPKGAYTSVQNGTTVLCVLLQVPRIIDYKKKCHIYCQDQGRNISCPWTGLPIKPLLVGAHVCYLLGDV